MKRFSGTRVRIVFALLAIGSQTSFCAETEETAADAISIPLVLQEFNVELDGDGVPTYAEKLTLALWAEHGGDLMWALANAEFKFGDTVDFSECLSGLVPTANLPAEDKDSEWPLQFSEVSLIEVGTSGRATPHCIQAADLDRDGDLDLVVAETETASVALLQNDGSGAFGVPVRYQIGMAPAEYPYVVAADVDGDEWTDLTFVGRNVPEVVILWHSGNGSFAQMFNPSILKYVHNVGAWGYTIAAADLDNDTFKDLIVGQYGSGLPFGKISALRNTGERSFLGPIELYPNSTPAPGAWSPDTLFIQTAALDSDALPDIVSSSGLVGINNSTEGSFSFSWDADARAGNRSLGVYASEAAIADFDGDGDLDLAAFSFGGQSAVLYLLEYDRMAPGAFSVSSTISAPEIGSSFSTTANDLDGDGDKDIVVANYNSFVARHYTFRNYEACGGEALSARFCEPAEAWDVCENCSGIHSLRVGDLNSDYRGDMFSAMIGDQGFYHIGMHFNVTTWKTFHRADPNTDNNTDIGDAIYLLGYLFSSQPAPSCMESGDANSDGRIDMADPIFVLAYLCSGGPPPPPPGPARPGYECGIGPPALGCDVYPHCTP